jgi:nanoRNase/pAp phosphatase (c-di-AMP/oligoRNAs hydrolase)
LKYFQAALGRLKTKRDTAFVFLGVVDNPDTLVILADFFMKISNIHRAITVGLYENRLVAIFRTLGIRRNAGREAIAAFGEFGSAGGHRSMARAEVPLANLPEKLVEKEGALERFLTRRLLAPPPKKEPASGSGNGKSA